MPNIISDVHDSLVEEYLHTLDSQILNRDKFILGKSKHGYLVPLIIYIRVI